MARSSSTAILLCLLLAPMVGATDRPAGAPATADVPSGMLVARTFRPQNLSLEEAVRVLKEMTGIEDLVADRDARTIVARAPAPTIRRMDNLLKTFDTEQPAGSIPMQIRVFRLDHITSLDAITLLRSKLQVTESAQAQDLRRVAVRDTPERLDQAAKLIAQADVAGD